METLEHHNGSHEQNKIKFFEEQRELMEEIYRKGFSVYAKGLAKIKDAFPERERYICCIDEGTPGGLHSAGSGILRDKEEVIKSFREARATEITSHDGCGAAGIYAKKMGLDPSKSDEYGRQWAKEIASAVGVPHRHITFSEMKRPKDSHIARVVYYDGTGKFDFSRVAGLPAGFIISRSIQGSDISLAEVDLSLGIASGDHGFGNLINQDNPMIFSAIGSNEEDKEKLMNELRTILASTGGKAIIDGFVAPK